ncbi:uncharacterized protein MYCFIDRAFT_44464 [Pseudocercospora fijiensis CIRAD86]|uniref:Helix-turn-helix domain-containing protein n=1 Tax=Pseudocercospora fijiensis (strain CIRAD86) TaxID=383855 RepID=N1Q5P4_PSEFD|nr:uncharacterized protein MYCFIDRAFT_44464 [Pseudocercospora fijiensis CIRAD86]EME87244.1 hypothetical protein MYCFIDRAFT_44464 [Pseudocercospora fijiensis CIRAD86]
MGSSASKASRAAGSAARKYPTRTPTQSPPTSSASATTSKTTTNAAPQPPPAAASQPGPTVKPTPRASGSRDNAINLDASDPDFAQSLRSIGPVQPNPTLSPTSAFNPNQAARSGPDPRQNPAVLVLEARAKLQEKAEIEFMEAGRRAHTGREFLDVYQIRQILTMRDQQGRKDEDIERRLGLKKGAVSRLGMHGIVGLAHETGRAEKEIRMV